MINTIPATRDRKIASPCCDEKNADSVPIFSALQGVKPRDSTGVVALDRGISATQYPL
jgi:hypothetical protein